MKIILSNYRYFMSGGPESYLFSIQDTLRAGGHTVFPFSVQSKHNRPSEFEREFLSPIGTGEETYFREYRKDIPTLAKVLARQFYSPEAFLKARRFANRTGADLVYSLQYLNKMSPALLDGFKSAGLPVVVRISDFGLLCPQAHFFDGKAPCTLCMHGNFLHAVRKRCVMDSRLASTLKAGSLVLSRLLNCQSRIDAFVFPSEFTLERFAKAGFLRHKLYHIPSALDCAAITPEYAPGSYFLYFGRLSFEKGVHDLLEAYRGIAGDKPRLLVVGAVPDTDYARSLMDEYRDVEFHPFVPKAELAAFARKALCCIIPSICYDNLPNALLEAFAYGKAVIAPAHGCFPDVVAPGETGLLYEPANSGALTDKLQWAMRNPVAMAEMGKRARMVAEREFSVERHYGKLMKVLTSILSAKTP